VKFALLALHFSAANLRLSAEDEPCLFQLARSPAAPNLRPPILREHDPAALQASFGIKEGHLNTAGDLLPRAKVILSDKKSFL
jgi:hypothetical protein